MITCDCGKYKGKKFRGVICDKCGTMCGAPFIEKHKVIRAIMHSPHGIFTVFLASLGILCFYLGIIPEVNTLLILVFVLGVVLAVLFFVAFLIYEIEESFHLKDGAYLDIFGWLCGFAIGVSAILWLIYF